MKKIILILAFLLPLNIFAQEENTDSNDYSKVEEPEMSTLFAGGDKIVHGGYGGPQIKVGKLEDYNAVMIGGRGGWVINHYFTLGIGGYGMVNAPNVEYAKLDTNIDAAIRAGYGGFYLEYTNNPNNVIHLTCNVLAGWGTIGFDEDQDFYGGFDDNKWHDDDDDNDRDDPYAVFFIVEPSIGLEMNITTFFRVGLEASYRFSNRIGSGKGFRNIDKIKDYNFDGFSGNLVFKFGLF